MMPDKRDWVFSLLWVNFAVVVVVLILIAGNQISSSHQLLYTLVYSLTYANLTGLLGLLILGGLARKLLRNPSMIPLVATAVLVVVPLGCLLAETLQMLLGFVVPRQFWREYLHTLRVAMPLAIVFGTGAMVHASLRGRVQSMEEKLREKEVAEERVRKLAAEARLRSLEARIHPHFLFNTLNSISSLIAVNPARAEQIVGRLAALLRASLDSSGQPLIPLKQELAMVENYLDIERARFGEKLRSSIEVPTNLESAKVPPMSVQSLVENAVKYGITPQSDGGEVVVTAAAEHGNLRIEILDTGPGFDLCAIPAGHGLDNLV
ncbi:MAG TPA: histidine kinase, partial [Bryobacteraceae bacterium]|nr:histidine kinase [Bryobacteraceae bacterium]